MHKIKLGHYPNEHDAKIGTSDETLALGETFGKPKPRSEWTVHHENMIYADGVFVTIIKDDGDRGRVIQMHNAAVKEAYQKGYDDGKQAR